MQLFRYTIFFLFTTFFVCTASFARQVFKGEYGGQVYCPNTCDLIDGFYLGPGIGWETYRFRETPGPFPPIPFSIGSPIAASGPVLGLIGGYGQYYGWFYIAGEVSAYLNKALYHFNYVTPLGLSYQTNLSLRHSYKASILPGFRINRHAIAYARIGYMRSLVKTTEMGVNALTTFYHSESNWADGVEYGIGIESALNPNMSIRGEFTHASFGSFPTQLETSFDPSMNQFVLSLLYHFNY